MTPEDLTKILPTPPGRPDYTGQVFDLANATAEIEGYLGVVRRKTSGGHNTVTRYWAARCKTCLTGRPVREFWLKTNQSSRLSCDDCPPTNSTH